MVMINAIYCVIDNIVLQKNLCNLTVDQDDKDRIKGMNNKSYNQNFKEWLRFFVKRKEINCG